GFHPRGGRYLQVSIQLPTNYSHSESNDDITLLYLGTRSAQVEVKREGQFACADTLFDWTWDACHATIQACVEDAFLDCPWRERGTYLGDALVEAGSLRSYTSDEAVTERSIDLWAQGQMPSGQMQACVPSYHRRPHPDFTLIWILLIHDLWTHTGKTDRIEQYWDIVGKIFTSELWRDSGNGLWDATDLHCFFDWGAHADAKTGTSNACLNAFRYRALLCASELATAIGKEEEADSYHQQAAEVYAAFCDHLWDERFMTFLAADGEEHLNHQHDLHGNILALHFGLYTDEQLPALLDYVCTRMETNCQQGIEKNQGSGHAELYFLSYVIPALYEHGKVAEAEAVIREHYGTVQRYGGWTIWEAFSRGVRGLGSQCHAWSCAASIAFSQHTLGVRPVNGDNNSIIIAPNSCLAWARGSVPHPSGLISVAWRREDKHLWIEYDAPAHVHVSVEPGSAFSDCSIHIQSL
ncbi:MAG: hypothetical protein HRU15_19665, partial [Planctomycetes bacterium]|nr:hypothetical protein [Planctomycetota bacterium]